MQEAREIRKKRIEKLKIKKIATKVTKTNLTEIGQKYSEIASKNTSHEIQITKHESEIVNLTAITNSYTETIETLKAQIELL